MAATPQQRAERKRPRHGRGAASETAEIVNNPTASGKAIAIGTIASHRAGIDPAAAAGRSKLHKSSLFAASFLPMLSDW